MLRKITDRKQYRKRSRASFLAVLLIMALLAGICISGCGNTDESQVKEEVAYDVPMEGVGLANEGAYTEDAMNASGENVDATGENADAAGGSQPDLKEGVGSGTSQKLITNWSINLETEKYDDFMQSLRQNVKDCGGYIQSEDDNGSEGNRYASLTIRIPENKVDGWVTKSTESGTVLSKSKSQRDVTLDYIDTESRLEALKSQRKALNRLLEKAESMEDIISIQNSLQDVTYQIESYESQLRYLQNDISYATVDMNISEVNRESDTGTGLGSRIKEEFAGSLNGVKAFGEGILVCLLGGAPIIVIVLAIIAVAILLIRKWKKHRKVKENGENTLN